MTLSTPPHDYPALPPPRSRRILRALAAVLLRTTAFLLLILLALAASFYVTRPRPQPPVQISPGITYECRQLPDTPQSAGLAHLITVDLTTPGLDLYVTPADPSAPPGGYQYTTRWTPRVAVEEKTAILVNAVLFDARYGSRGPPGDLARANETLIANHHINHDYGIYMLWFEDDLTPHIELQGKLTDEVRQKAKWAVGSQIVLYAEGQRNAWGTTARDRRTLFGVDTARKKLYIGVFDSISEVQAATILAELGAKRVVPVDGGTSTALVLGHGVNGVSPGAVVYPLRALPTHFGIRVK